MRNGGVVQHKRNQGEPGGEMERNTRDRADEVDEREGVGGKEMEKIRGSWEKYDGSANTKRLGTCHPHGGHWISASGWIARIRTTDPWGFVDLDIRPSRNVLAPPVAGVVAELHSTLTSCGFIRGLRTILFSLSMAISFGKSSIGSLALEIQ